MGFSYLDNKNWIDITREERLFCAHLYWEVKGNEEKFVAWLNSNSKSQSEKGLKLNPKDNWEMAFEACFYRDFLKSKREPVRPSDYSPKRTFDLCLFSEKAIVIIEAKAQQLFKNAQVAKFMKDKNDIHSLVGDSIDILIVALASETYFKNYLKKYPSGNLLYEFDAYISWDDLYQYYKNPLYQSAEKIYKH